MFEKARQFVSGLISPIQIQSGLRHNVMLGGDHAESMKASYAEDSREGLDNVSEQRPPGGHSAEDEQPFRPIRRKSQRNKSQNTQRGSVKHSDFDGVTSNGPAVQYSDQREGQGQPGNKDFQSKSHITDDKQRARENLQNQILKAELDGQRSIQQALERENAMFKASEASLGGIVVSQNKKLQDYERHFLDQMENIRRLETTAREQHQAAEEREALLDIRTKELQDAQVFLAMTDICSGSDVVKMVHRLNAEIHQLSGYLTDLVEDMEGKEIVYHAWRECVPARADEFIRKALGHQLVSFLRRRDPSLGLSTDVFQNATQALLAAWAEQLTQIFDSGGDGYVVASLYERIRTSETQTVSAKWRAITAQKLQARSQDTDNEKIDFIHCAIIGLLAVAGWFLELHGSSKISAKIQEGLCIIHKRAMEIGETIREGILSCDLELVTCEKSISFDFSSMTNYNGKNGTYLPGRNGSSNVLCTVALGLKKSTTQHEGQQYQVITQLLLKPQVVLNSGFDHPEDSDDGSEMQE